MAAQDLSGPTPALTDVPGVLVGHAHDSEALTGCTVVLTLEGAVGGVDVRGGGPSTRETDLLGPLAGAAVHAVALCGGSAFGLAAASGVCEWLRERGAGYDVGGIRVPIVPAAVIFDLRLGRGDRWADAAMGRAACEAAGATTAEGCVGVGMGASSGKLLGMALATKTGVGSWSERLPDGTTVGALAVCNAFGDVWREHGGILAGARDPAGGGFADTRLLLRQGRAADLIARRGARALAEGGNTTLAVVATDAALSKPEAVRLAQMAQDGLSRTVRPVHTPFDGDTVFALSTGRRPALHLAILGTVAADVVARAIERAATEATSAGGLPAPRDLPAGAG